MFDASKRAYFVKVIGEQATAGLEAGLEGQKNRLEDLGVDWASLDKCVGPACAGQAARQPAAAAPARPTGRAATSGPVADLQRTVREVKAELRVIDAREREADRQAAAAAPIAPYLAMFASPPAQPQAEAATAVAELRNPYAHPAAAHVADLVTRGAVQS